MTTTENPQVDHEQAFASFDTGAKQPGLSRDTVTDEVARNKTIYREAADGLRTIMASMTSVYGSAMLAPLWDQLAELDEAATKLGEAAEWATAESGFASDQANRYRQMVLSRDDAIADQRQQLSGYVAALEQHIVDSASRPATGKRAVGRIRRNYPGIPTVRSELNN